MSSSPISTVIAKSVVAENRKLQENRRILKSKRDEGMSLAEILQEMEESLAVCWWTHAGPTTCVNIL